MSATTRSTLGVFTVALMLGPHTGAAQDASRLPSGPAGTVTISRPDYDRLIDLAGKQPRGPEIPPLPAALTRTDVRARVDGGVVRATMLVEGEVFRTGTVKVPLISGATLLEARMGDRPLPLVAEHGTHFAVLAGPSTFSLTLEWGASLTTTPGRGSFTMPVPSSGSATATIDVPGEQTDVRINPGLVARRVTLTTGRTIVEVTLDPGSPAQVWWSTREAAPTAQVREARVLSSVKTLVTIGEADLRLVTLLDLTIVQGEPSEFELRIPAGFEVAGITGASLERSEERPDRVVLFVRNAAQRRHQFLVNLERQHGGGSLRLATGFPTLPAAQRETGEVAVEGIGTLEVSSPETPALRRMDVREIDPVLASAARQSLPSAYRYQRGSTPEPVLTLDVTRFANWSASTCTLGRERKGTAAGLRPEVEPEVEVEPASAQASVEWRATRPDPSRHPTVRSSVASSMPPGRLCLA